MTNDTAADIKAIAERLSPYRDQQLGIAAAIQRERDRAADLVAARVNELSAMLDESSGGMVSEMKPEHIDRYMSDLRAKTSQLNKTVDRIRRGEA